MGGYFNNYKFKPLSNQYFTISIFDAESGIARRRKSLFVQTHVIVLDDVKEKLPMSEVNKLPLPSYILETSQGSEQWGYILDTPCKNRLKVENLLDGLVANGLAPAGQDPGMKGVTRYVRLPEGINNKSNKLVKGKPFKCRLLSWYPFSTVTLDELATPFNINLDEVRKSESASRSANIPDHPFLKSSLIIKKDRGNGKFDITCPWVNEHTKSVDNGAVVWTNSDSTGGFKCHHGHCESRNLGDVLNYLEFKKPGFISRYNEWKLEYAFKKILPSGTPPSHHNVKPEKIDHVQQMLDQISKEKTGSKLARTLSADFLKIVDGMQEIDKTQYHKEICTIMGWSKGEFVKILKELKQTWYEKKTVSFYDSVIFVKNQNKFYDFNSKIFYTPEGFQNSFGHEDSDARKEALMNGKVEKVDRMDFCPKKTRIFTEAGVKFANMWSATKENAGKEGDCSKWLDHWDVLGWGVNKDHMLKWMAYTILKPEFKINHMLLLGGMEGTGKDFLLWPLLHAMSGSSTTIEGNELLTQYNNYLMNNKYLHINETELGDHKAALEISNKLKPLAAAPPNIIRVRDLFISHVNIQNVVNVSMATNSQMPIKLNGPSRRFYAVWTDLQVKDEYDDTLPKWLDYWNTSWEWMNNGGVDHCIWYLRNCVDISKFKPGEPPKMTDFLRNIRESSKSPGQQTIEAFISNQIGVFKSDLITVNEGHSTLKSGMFVDEDIMYVQSSWFTPNKVSRILRDISGCVKLKAKGDKEIKIWAIRNKERYECLSSVELYEAYLLEMKLITRNGGIMLK